MKAQRFYKKAPVSAAKLHHASCVFLRRVEPRKGQNKSRDPERWRDPG
ncbi:hypothetical protein [Pyramidobacter sp. C12-8]|nr:hypothetical protein [Pyramidobacter sp. C12-8]